MEASSSSSQKCSDTELDNKEQTTSERQVCGKTADLAINRDGEEHARIGNAKAVQDDGHQETVTYQCKKCDRKFARADNMKTHILTKHTESAVSCYTCSTKFKTSVALEKHLVKEYCPLQCDSCAKTFMQKVRLDSHKLVCMDGGFVKKECTFCGTVFSRRIDYERHKQHMRKRKGSYEFFCQDCGKRCCTYEMLKHHYNIETKGDTGHVRKSFEGETEKTGWWERNKALAKKNDEDPESDDDSNLKSKELNCEFCGTKFRWKANLKKHQREIYSTGGSFKFECGLCGDFSCTGKLAKAHFSSKHRNIECMDCGQVFNKKQHLNLHSKMKIPYLCSDCGKRFCNRQSFTIHMARVHFKLLERDWN